MIEFKTFLAQSELNRWHKALKTAIDARLNPSRHGDLDHWVAQLNLLPNLTPSFIELNKSTVTVGRTEDASKEDIAILHKVLFSLCPWRKGPYRIFGIHIDTEWRSDWKWQRVMPHISNLNNRKVLDVGCGTGYHCWRMLGAGADYVMGIDPSPRFIVQHNAIQKYMCNDRFDFLPVGIEDMPNDMPYFDTVFSMGVLYHRRNPINHLHELRKLMRTGGELVLETLIVDQAEHGILKPEKRYAQMRNVWSIMTVDKILMLLHEAGFQNPRCVNQNTTSLQEQRSTPWMTFHSLRDFLDPTDISKTVEGYPAPKRGLFIADR